MTINVVVPSRNCAQWIDRALESLVNQTHQPDRVLVVDDASDQDNYPALYAAWCANRQGWAALRLTERHYCPMATRTGIATLRAMGAQPYDVIFTLDGDDFLPPWSLERIAEVYEDPDVWLSYGNYEPYPENTGQTLASAYPWDVMNDRTFRYHLTTRFNHPRTFRLHLYDRLTDADFQTDDGRWLTAGGDYLTMVPMMEMAGVRHIRFLDETLYYYNAVNPESEYLVIADRGQETHEHLLRRPMKDRIVD
jgi:glycosyltransferase involved in cell wall biosynthesis